jgi:quercetin dioxygenase-like cupin family protein
VIAQRTHRRPVLKAAGIVAAAQLLAPTSAKSQAGARKGYVLGPNEGEHLIMRGGNIFIKVDPTRGMNSLAMGTQQVLKDVGIPIHRHFEMDEAFYVIDGTGTFVLDDVSHRLEKGGSIFIPKNTWHGFQNPDGELVLLWLVSPPGLEAFFREVATRPGIPPTQRTKAELNEIARKYATEFK